MTQRHCGNWSGTHLVAARWINFNQNLSLCSIYGAATLCMYSYIICISIWGSKRLKDRFRRVNVTIFTAAQSQKRSHGSLSHSMKQWEIVVQCSLLCRWYYSLQSSRSFLFVRNLCQQCKPTCSNPSLASLGKYSVKTWPYIICPLWLHCFTPDISHSSIHTHIRAVTTTKDTVITSADFRELMGVIQCHIYIYILIMHVLR